MCLDRVGGPVHISAHRTVLKYSDKHLDSPWSSQAHRAPVQHEVTPCPNHFNKERYSEKGEIGAELFQSTPDNNMVSMSQEDKRFLEIMEMGIHKNKRGNWEMPLPFHSPNTVMPNNRSLAVNRLRGLLNTFKKKPKMKEEYFTFMGKIIERGHAVHVRPEELDEVQTSLPETSACNRLAAPDQRKQGGSNDGRMWYLPHFGVYHPKKPDQIRVVFDSSAEFQGVSINKELLPRSDLMNSLVGVQIRYGKENIVVMCDIEKMFHTFHVNVEHQNFLRFLWFEDNDLSKEIVEYRMTVHLFGNAPSPAIATFGLTHMADDGEEKFGKETSQFVHRNFYVDDGLSYHKRICQFTQKRTSNAGYRKHQARQSCFERSHCHGSVSS